MQSTLSTLLERNRAWAQERVQEDADFFARQVNRHKPNYLWIGCADARVPANALTQTVGGEMFVHRNIANQVLPTDASLLAVLQYAIEALGVTDVVVCGHEQCGGVKGALGQVPLPDVDAWIEGIRTVRRLHASELDAIADEDARYRRLIELNVVEQVATLGGLPVVRAAWERGAELRLHGVVYDIGSGTLRDLGVTRASAADAPTVADAAGDREVAAV